MNNLKLIQQTLNAPKNQRNTFGNYNYRSCEDIFNAVKPLLKDAILTVSDEIVAIGDRIYVKATATYKNGDFEISNTAFAREPATKKGMDDSQITGATSSYARKYALNGLFLIDDVKDADTQDNRAKSPLTGKEKNTIHNEETREEFSIRLKDGTDIAESLEALLQFKDDEITKSQMAYLYKHFKETFNEIKDYMAEKMYKLEQGA